MFPQSGARRASVGTRNNPLEVKQQFSLIIPVCFLCFFCRDSGGRWNLPSFARFCVDNAWLDAFSCRSSMRHCFCCCTFIDIVVPDSSLALMSRFSCSGICYFDVCSLLLLLCLCMRVSFFFCPSQPFRTFLYTTRRLCCGPPPRRQHIIGRRGTTDVFSVFCSCGVVLSCPSMCSSRSFLSPVAIYRCKMSLRLWGTHSTQFM